MFPQRDPAKLLICAVKVTVYQSAGDFHGQNRSIPVLNDQFQFKRNFNLLRKIQLRRS